MEDFRNGLWKSNARVRQQDYLLKQYSMIVPYQVYQVDHYYHNASKLSLKICVEALPSRTVSVRTCLLVTSHYKPKSQCFSGI